MIHPVLYQIKSNLEYLVIVWYSSRWNHDECLCLLSLFNLSITWIFPLMTRSQKVIMSKLPLLLNLTWCLDEIASIKNHHSLNTLLSFERSAHFWTGKLVILIKNCHFSPMFATFFKSARLIYGITESLGLQHFENRVHPSSHHH